MRRLLLVVAAALAFAGGARAAVPRPDAAAFEVLDASSGDVLAGRNEHVQLPMASLTKLMTVVVALDHLDPGQTVTVTRQAARVGESRIPLHAGEQVTVLDLLKGALIQSANDAADALAAAAADGDVDRFVGWMNDRARALGLRDTHFVRPDGLDAPGHVSSVHDLLVLAQVAMRSPLVRSIVRERSDTIEDGRVPVHTWNDLLGVVPGLVGVKTGHTDLAGWCEVAAVRRRGVTLYVAILGSPTRAQRNADLERLLAWGVSRFRRTTLVARTPYAWAALPYGRPAVPLVPARSVARVVRVDQTLVRRVVAPSVVSLPVVRGQALGRVEIWRGGTLLASEPLVAGRSVGKPGLAGKVRWYGTRTVHDLWGLLP